MKRIYANELTSWMRYNCSFMANLTKLKLTTPRQRGRRTKHLFDGWPMHGTPKAPLSTAEMTTQDVPSVVHQKRNNTLTLHVATRPWWSCGTHIGITLIRFSKRIGTKISP